MSGNTKSSRASTNFQVIVDPDEWTVLQRVITAACSKFGECSWFGIGPEPTDLGCVRIDRIVYPKQQNSTGASDIDDLAQADLISSLADDERILWWGHSHGNMGAFYSSKDDDTWDNWMASRPEFFLGTCHNVKGETYQRLCVRGLEVELKSSPFRLPLREGIEEAVEEALSQMEKFAPPVRVYPKSASIQTPGVGMTGMTGMGTTSLAVPKGLCTTFREPSTQRVKTRIRDLEAGAALSAGSYKKKGQYSLFEILIPNLLGNFLLEVTIRSRQSISLTFHNDLDVTTTPNQKTRTLYLESDWVDDLLTVGIRHGILETQYNIQQDEVNLLELRQDISYMLMWLSDVQNVQLIFPWAEISSEFLKDTDKVETIVFGDADYTEAMLAYYTTMDKPRAEDMLLYTGKEDKFLSIDFDRSTLMRTQMELAGYWWNGSEPDWSAEKSIIMFEETVS